MKLKKSKRKPERRRKKHKINLTRRAEEKGYQSKTKTKEEDLCCKEVIKRESLESREKISVVSCCKSMLIDRH